MCIEARLSLCVSCLSVLHESVSSEYDYIFIINPIIKDVGDARAAYYTQYSRTLWSILNTLIWKVQLVMQYSFTR